MTAEVPRELLEAYLATRYRFAFDGREREFRIGAVSAELAAVHAARGADCSSFITAWNPRSEPTDEDENRRRNRALEADLRAAGYAPLPARGTAEKDGWCEESFLVPGLAEEEALALARKYRQVAIVCAGVDAVPRLVIA